jgi:hypothetical protein
VLKLLNSLEFNVRFEFNEEANKNCEKIREYSDTGDE